MKKTLRITTEMRYLNNRERVTVAEMMAEFNISRSTAMRDLAEIEELGFPLVSVSGHNGGYRVLRNQTLPAVTFTKTEVQALFVAFLATTNQELPYLKNRQAISEKLLSIVSDAQQTELLKLNQLLWFENTNPDDPSLLELTDTAPQMLGKLISTVVQTPQLRISYLKRGATTPVDHEVYVMHLYNRQQIWYAACYDLTRHARRTLRVDRMHALAPTQQPVLSAHEAQQLWRADQHEPNVELILHGDAISRFRRLHQPGSRLIFLDPFQQTARFVDYIDDQPAGVQLYADWLLFLGDNLEIKQLPTAVQTVMRQKMQRWRTLLLAEQD